MIKLIIQPGLSAWSEDDGMAVIRRSFVGGKVLDPPVKPEGDEREDGRSSRRETKTGGSQPLFGESKRDLSFFIASLRLDRRVQFWEKPPNASLNTKSISNTIKKIKTY